MKNQIKKVLSLMLAIVMCMSTLVLGVSAEDECLHENSLYLGVKEATCTEKGGDKYQCQDCGEIYVDEWMDAHGHVYNCRYCEEAHTEAECQWWCESDWNYAEGVCSATCVVCGEVEELDHIQGEPGESCGQWFCANCGEAVNVGIDNEDNLAHNYVFVPEKTVEPNCNDKDKASGYLFFQCTECGAEKKLTANGQHTLTRVLAKAPTCTEDGWEEHYVCNTCNKTFKNYTDTAIAATTYDPKIEKLGHVDADATVEDCVETGDCERCGLEDYTQDAHVLTTVDVEATCQNGKGTKTTCANCDYLVYSNTTDVVDHKFVVDPNGSGNEDKKATCDVAGWEGKYVCEYGCGETYGADKEIPAGCKNEDKYFPATCTTDAYTCKKCTVCGKETEVKPVEGEKADGKSHLMIPVTLPATCTEAGAKGTMCLYCDEKGEWEVLPATGHSYPATPDLHLDATCSSFAQDYYGCTNPGCTSVKSVIGTKYDTSRVGHVKHIFNITNQEDYEEFRASDDFDAFRAAYGTMISVPTCEQTGLWMIACTCGSNFFDVGDEYYHGDFATQTSYIIENAIFKSEYEALDCLKGTTATMGDWCVECEAFIGETEEVTHESLRDVIFTVIDEETYAPVAFVGINFATEAKVDHVCNVRDEIFVDGYAEFDYCVTCREAYANIVDGVDVRNLYYDALKAAHADEKNHQAVLVEGQDAYCSWNGKSAKKHDGWKDYCSVCEKATDTGIKTTKDHRYVYDIVDLAGKVEPTCTTPGFNARVCADCGFGNVATGSYYKELGHDFSVFVETVAPTCTEKGYDIYKCDACEETTKTNFKDELKHVNVHGDKFTGACNDTEDERICVRCGLDVPAAHEYEIVVTAPTCLEGGYSVKTCVHCGASEKFGETEALGHDEDDTEWLYDDFTEPTYTKPGEAVGICGRCEEKYTEVIPALEGIEMQITVDSGIREGADIVNGGLVKVTVALGANMSLNTLMAKIVYDSDNLTFVDAKVENIFEVKDDTGATTVITTSSVGNTVGLSFGCVTVMVDATENTANGAPVDVALVTDEITFVTLTFRVAEDAAYDSADVSGLISEILSVEEGIVKDNNGALFFKVADAMSTYQNLTDEYEEELYELDNAMQEYERLENALSEPTYGEWKAAEEAVDAAKAALKGYYEGVEEIETLLEEVIYENFGERYEIRDEEEMRRTLMSFVDILEDTLDFGDTASETIWIYKLGDINVDWRINSSDALALRQLMFTKVDGKIEDGEFTIFDYDEEDNEIEVETNYLAEADVDMDGEITLADYALLSQHLVGSITYEELVLTSQN